MHTRVDCKRCWRGRTRWRVRRAASRSDKLLFLLIWIATIACCRRLYRLWTDPRCHAFIFFHPRFPFSPFRGEIPSMNYFPTKRIPLVSGLVVARWCIYRERHLYMYLWPNVHWQSPFFFNFQSDREDDCLDLSTGFHVWNCENWFV